MYKKTLTPFNYDRIMTDQIKKHVIAILVDNEFGALARIVELFSARGYNIESLNVAPTSLDKKLSRITITTYGTTKTVDLICKLLKRIVPVHTAAELTREHGYIERELALVQIIADEQKREEALKLIDKYRTHIVEIAGDSMVFEVIGTTETIDELLVQLPNFGLASVSRTGIAAGFKGEKKLANV
jgi:acetolactate synthase-1/3 small subunit